jgi:uncharacterized protein
MARRIEPFFIQGPAGRLEALLEEPEGVPAIECAVVCHPHPMHGGTMHNKVVHRTARALRRSGCVTLRFNYRGVNLSEGTYDHANGESDDARAAVESLRARYPSLPLTMAGFSFGARIVSRVHGGARRVILAGYPTVYGQFDDLRRCTAPRCFVHSTHDEYGPKEQLQALYDGLWGPKALHWVEARGHFFDGALDKYEEIVAAL